MPSVVKPEEFSFIVNGDTFLHLVDWLRNEAHQSREGEAFVNMCMMEALERGMPTDAGIVMIALWHLGSVKGAPTTFPGGRPHQNVVDFTERQFRDPIIRDAATELWERFVRDMDEERVHDVSEAERLAYEEDAEHQSVEVYLDDPEAAILHLLGLA